jgi:hypothetical protein
MDVRTALTYMEMHRAEVEIGVGLFVATLAGSLAIMVFVLVRMPADYLNTPENAPFWPERPAWMRIGAQIGKNLLGVMLVALGVLLSLPGVPGQGVLTILIGVMLLDIPGKRRLERRMFGAPKVLAAINRLRARFKRPALHEQREQSGSAPRNEL